ncbi:glutathione S-transferase [Haematobacter massiliensis]|uniref:Glutathione S-transferase n=1 Tax=Haematobacter massiliensis TaxID=195105 RepID=A0A086Y2A3_9RHOB|nr:glutathione S-transferase family protein [Haematobacter massiliensis]KFI28403.1 glutathione S-transferase [Haematobacter massiliensis]OWJ84656.1 glutathione S-transferase [Haematobacter massiliensis]QBJ26379.1 glutathione S-transferase family protein [Haematobacter massiliensis]
MIELWHCEGARSFRALWALEEMGLPYCLHMLPFPPRALRKEYLSVNPLGTIPYLIDGEERLTESAAIPHYLATRHGPSPLALAPEEPGYGAYLNWLHHGEATLTFPQTLTLRYTVFDLQSLHAQVGKDYRKWFLSRLRMLSATLEDGRAHLVGGRFTMADVVVAYAIQLAGVTGARAEIAPHVLAWADALQSRPGWQRARAAEREGAAALAP